jgi:hypothetical protein
MEYHANINMGSPQFLVPFLPPTCVDSATTTYCQVIDFGLNMSKDNLTTPKVFT